MSFYCKLCQNELLFTSSFCEECRQIKRILNIYGRDEVLSILEKVCLRSEKQREYKIKDVKKNLSDSVYIDPNGIRKTPIGKGPQPN